MATAIGFYLYGFAFPFAIACVPSGLGFHGKPRLQLGARLQHRFRRPHFQRIARAQLVLLAGYRSYCYLRGHSDPSGER